MGPLPLFFKIDYLEAMSTQQPNEANERPLAEGGDPRLKSHFSDVEADSKNSCPIIADPTRFGDWERAGRCIDF